MRPAGELLKSADQWLEITAQILREAPDHLGPCHAQDRAYLNAKAREIEEWRQAYREFAGCRREYADRLRSEAERRAKARIPEEWILDTFRRIQDTRTPFPVYQAAILEAYWRGVNVAVSTAEHELEEPVA